MKVLFNFIYVQPAWSSFILNSIQGGPYNFMYNFQFNCSNRCETNCYGIFGKKWP